MLSNVSLAFIIIHPVLVIFTFSSFNHKALYYLYLLVLGLELDHGHTASKCLCRVWNKVLTTLKSMLLSVHHEKPRLVSFELYFSAFGGWSYILVG